MHFLLMAFLTDEYGQDLTEYSLILVFVLLIIVGLVTNSRDSVAGIVDKTNQQLTAASTAAVQGNPAF